MNDFSILIVDDDPEIRSGLRRFLESKEYEVHEAQDGDQALEQVKDQSIDVVLTDIYMPTRSGVELLADLKQTHPEIPVILFTGFSSVQGAVEAIKLGADDYLVKPVDLHDLNFAIQRTLNKVQTLRQNRLLKRELTRQRSRTIVGKTKAMHKILASIERVAPRDIPVLLLGETGTGKELAARAIHDASSRRTEAFVAINCAAIPADLLESELFGHERGAFSGANTRKYGLFETAHKGTLFLDEIGEMSPALQAKLLRTLETGEFRRIGGVKEIRVDVRLVSSTNRDLKAEMNKGSFREDLYYRLSGMDIVMPPLRKRVADIPLLVTKHLQDRGSPEVTLSPDALAMLKQYRWPGNVRELFHVVDRGLLYCEDDVIRPEDWPGHLSGDLAADDPPGRFRQRPLSEVEREHIERTLESVGGNQRQAADILGISKKTLYNKLKRYQTPHSSAND